MLDRIGNEAEHFEARIKEVGGPEAGRAGRFHVADVDYAIVADERAQSILISWGRPVFAMALGMDEARQLARALVDEADKLEERPAEPAYVVETDLERRQVSIDWCKLLRIVTFTDKQLKALISALRKARQNLWDHTEG